MSYPIKTPATTAIRPLDRPPLEIVDLAPEATRPSVVLQGGSGTGKTHAIESLLASGTKLLVLGVEAKLHALAKYRPKAIYLTAPTPEGRYTRLMQFVDELAQGRHRGFDAIAIDGTGEIVDIIHRRYRAKLTSRANTLPMWDDIGIEAVDVFRTIRDAAGYASHTQGLAPVGIVATIAERRTQSPLGQMFYEPMLPGKKAAEALPYQFEVMIRLSARTGDDGNTIYSYHTTSTDEWYAKTPPGLFPATIEGTPPGAPSFADVYAKLIAHYSPASTSTSSRSTNTP